jgi:ferredoxin
VKASVNRESCVGHGRCNATAPDVYTLDEVGYCNIGEKDIPTDLEDAAQDGADACPEMAITVT